MTPKPDHGNLPHLLKLLDDESPVVRKAVAEGFAAYGSDLTARFDALPDPPDPIVRGFVEALLEDRRRERFLATWPGWFSIEAKPVRLERALGLLCGFLSKEPADCLSGMLDGLADSYQKLHDPVDPRSLSRYLFGTRALRGDQLTYHDPRNSDLIQVLRRRRGLPISLSLVYMLVGHRLGMGIEGCTLPVHFMARVGYEGTTWFVDCFDRGRFLTQRELLAAYPRGDGLLRAAMQHRAEPETIVLRVLNNLEHAWREYPDPEGLRLVEELREQVAAWLASERKPDSTGEVRFPAGTVIRHRRYGYRGVVVDTDTKCRASETWYRKNQTQPDRNQPWYSVLVHETSQVTYAAESNLVLDKAGKPITHPLVGLFFSGFDNKAYVRNNRPWPKPGR